LIIKQQRKQPWLFFLFNYRFLLVLQVSSP
jgi:hypothetical protein